MIIFMCIMLMYNHVHTFGRTLLVESMLNQFYSMYLFRAVVCYWVVGSGSIWVFFPGLKSLNVLYFS